MGEREEGKRVLDLVRSSLRFDGLTREKMMALQGKRVYSVRVATAGATTSSLALTVGAGMRANCRR